MFGGGNDNTAVQPADNQAGQQDAGMSDAPSNGLTPGDAPMAGYDAAADATHAATPAADAAAPATTEDPVPPAASAVQPAASVPDDVLTAVPDDLLNIKQQALQQLSPLVGHLDQTPEEKFRTTMMMIQASDNADLIPDAYAAAQQIADEKTRAQALLDVVNEINYFTQHHDQPQQ